MKPITYFQGSHKRREITRQLRYPICVERSMDKMPFDMYKLTPLLTVRAMLRDRLARQIAGLTQHVVDSGPMGEPTRKHLPPGQPPSESRLTPYCGCPARAGSVSLCCAVAEYDLMARAREERAEFAADQSGTENTNSHGTPSRSISDRSASCVPRRAAPHGP